MRILVVDDEIDICEILRFNLESEGFTVDTATSAEEALSMLCPSHSLILLDVMLERMSGFEMAQQLRSQGNEIPIIFLTALGSECDQLRGFGVGADDYISKPFSFASVLARINAVLKRTTVAPAQGLVLDESCHDLLVDNDRVRLTNKEYSIMKMLLDNEGIYHGRDEILDVVWGNEVMVTERSVDVHVARLRKKLGHYGENLVNRSGLGYAFVRESK